MAATICGIGALYHTSKPPVEVESASLSESTVEEEALLTTGPIEASAKAEEALEPKAAVTIDDQKFTPWLSPQALDDYIQNKNQGFEQTFWQRGHWIRAVEGRWGNGNHEFRIAYEPLPNPDTWQWQYRVNQSQNDFAASIKEMSVHGYSLYQTQFYKRPDGARRFQGVWQREIGDLQTMVGNSTDPGASPQ